MADRLSLTNALSDASIDRQKAERIATEILDLIHDNVATKADLRDLELRLKLWLGSLIVATGGATDGILFAALHYWPPHP